ncbi:hypothetical protein D3C72_1092900 [compost metagenome]
MDNYLSTTSRGGSLSDIIKYSSDIKTISMTGGTGKSIEAYTIQEDGFILATCSFFTANQTATSQMESGLSKNGQIFAWDQEVTPSTGTYRMTSAAGMINVVKGDIIRMYCFTTVTGTYTYNCGYMFYPNN